MGKSEPESADKEPKYIHECVEAAGGLPGFADIVTERPKG